MKNISLNCKVDFITNSIIVTKTFLRKSADPTTEEFRMMRELTTQMPNLAVRVKQSTPAKRPLSPTYDQMLRFLEYHDPEALETFETVRRTAQMTRNAYMYVKKWFMDQYADQLEFFAA